MRWRRVAVNGNGSTPAYNVKVVVRETGLSADTLRIWERRYGVPRPVRSSGGHRLYSQHDLDLLKWLVARQGEGMSISRAVERWRQVNASQRAPAPSADATPPDNRAEEPLGDIRQLWVKACLAFDEPTAETILTQALALHPPETVCELVLQRGLAEIGVRWYAGETSEHQEHLATELAVRHVELLVARAPTSWRRGRLLVGCPPDEQHSFAPLLLTLLLRRRGWETTFLGANVPLQHFDSAVQSIRPALVILAAQRLETATRLVAMGDLLRHIDIPLAYGGAIFNQSPSLRAMIPGYFMGETLREAADTAERLALQAALPVPPFEPSEGSRRILTRYRTHLVFVEGSVARDLLGSRLDAEVVSLANAHLAEAITAALHFDDLDLLSHQISWLTGLLEHREVPQDIRPAYLASYARAIQATLGDEAASLVERLTSHL